jgi:hypothetical protein
VHRCARLWAIQIGAAANERDVAALEQQRAAAAQWRLKLFRQ